MIKEIYNIVYRDLPEGENYFVSPFKSKSSLEEALKIFRRTIEDFDKTFRVERYEVSLVDTEYES